MIKIKIYDEGKKIYSDVEKDRKKIKKKFDDFFNQKYN